MHTPTPNRQTSTEAKRACAHTALSASGAAKGTPPASEVQGTLPGAAALVLVQRYVFDLTSTHTRAHTRCTHMRVHTIPQKLTIAHKPPHIQIHTCVRTHVQTHTRACIQAHTNEPTYLSLSSRGFHTGRPMWGSSLWGTRCTASGQRQYFRVKCCARHARTPCFLRYWQRTMLGTTHYLIPEGSTSRTIPGWLCPCRLSTKDRLTAV